VSVLLQVQVVDGARIDDLQRWMEGLHPDIALKQVSRVSGANAQGTVWDFLEVACASGGAVTAAVRALQLWIESRVTSVEIVVGESKFTVKTADARVALPSVEAAAKALEAGDPDSGGGE